MADSKQPNFTKVPNYILEELAKRDFNASELVIILVTARATLGFQKKSHTLGYGFYIQATGLSRNTVIRTVKKLIDSKVLICYEPSIGSKPSKIGLNQKYSEWLVYPRMGIPKSGSARVPTDGYSEYPTVTSGVPTGGYQKRNIKKEIYKEEEKKSFTPIYTEEEIRMMFEEDDEDV